MPLTPPKIDTRTYDDLVREIRTRIPQYTPEWTDLNDNDPGMALTQLFAWMSEQLIYRLGKVPQHNYIKFLDLVGIEPNPATPARAEVVFQMANDATSSTVVVPKGTQLAAEGDEGQVIFETERALIVIAPRLVAVQSKLSSGYALLTESNTDTSRAFHPLGKEPSTASELLLGFEYAEPFPAETTFDLMVWAPSEGKETVAETCGIGATQKFTSVRLAWEYWDGVEWISLEFRRDESGAFTRSGRISLKSPPAGRMQRASIGNVSESLYWIRARLLDGQYERPPEILLIRANTVPVVQAETIENEVLGGSDGMPDQVLRLENPPILPGTLVLDVDEMIDFDDPEEGVWTEVADFFGSGSKDRHYVLDRTRGEVRFGDGESGRIPVANVSNPSANVVARVYQTGGGRKGNLPADSITTLLTSIDGIDSNAITNPFASAGGSEEETFEEVTDRAPRTLKARCRAVTPEDFEDLAKQAGNVARAKALPLFHPDFPTVPVPGAVTVIVVPDSDAPNPTPNAGTLKTVCAYLDQRRLLTTEVFVVGPHYQRAEIRGEVVARPDADLGEVREGLQTVLNAYLHPLTGGDDGKGWPFGGTIYFSGVYQKILSVPGVLRAGGITIRLDADEFANCTDAPIKTNGLVYSTGHQIDVIYPDQEGTS